MGFLWDVVKGVTKTAVNIHSNGAFDMPVWDDEQSNAGTEDKTHSEGDVGRDKPASDTKLYSAAAGMNSLELSRGTLRELGARKISSAAMNQLNIWLRDAFLAKQKPVPLPTQLILALLLQEFSIETLGESDPAGYTGYSGVAWNVEDKSMNVIILNPLSIPVIVFSFSAKQNSSAWNHLKDLFGAAQGCMEPPAPWVISYFNEKGALFYEPCIVWLSKIEYSLATLYMALQS